MAFSWDNSNGNTLKFKLMKRKPFIVCDKGRTGVGKNRNEGWSDSYIRTNTSTIHYYKDGVSLCGRSKVDLGNRHFEKGEKNINDAYSHHCKLCIKKQAKI